MSDIDLSKLAEPFPAEDVEWRIGRSGEKNGRAWATCFAYIDNRAIQSRLDEVCGIGGWQNQLVQVSGGWLCGISIKINGEWVTKWDGSDATDFEAFKGGISGSQKRAASQWGIGRYLYELEEGFATICDNGKFKQSGKDSSFRWNPPQLPAWALPKNQTPTPARQDVKPIKPTPYLEWTAEMREGYIGKFDAIPTSKEVKAYLEMTAFYRERFKNWVELEKCGDPSVFAELTRLLGEWINKGQLVAA